MIYDLTSTEGNQSSSYIMKNWIFDEEKNSEYWALENRERIHPNYDANAIIDWLNNVRFKKGIAKAK